MKDENNSSEMSRCYMSKLQIADDKDNEDYQAHIAEDK